MSQNRSSAVMAQRAEPVDSLDYFPTPPWATRALLHHHFGAHVSAETMARWRVWEPAAGGMHMADALAPHVGLLHATDIFPHSPRHDDNGDFCGGGLTQAQCPFEPDWIITNPPFNQAIAFLERALPLARQGVALLLRTAWLDTNERAELFEHAAPSWARPFAERVPMVKGRWDPVVSTATGYCWFIWDLSRGWREETRLRFLPRCREQLTRPDDALAFGAEHQLVIGRDDDYAALSNRAIRAFRGRTGWTGQIAVSATDVAEGTRLSIRATEAPGLATLAGQMAERG